jgi:Tfp pilus assembly protein PilX
MENKNIRNTKYEIRNTNKAGTALLMTILILNSILLITMASAKLIISSVRESGVQVKSTKAFFAAEAGAERVLYEYRKVVAGSCYTTINTCHFTANLSGGSSYKVDWISGDNNPGSTLTFISAGTFSGLKRSDELNFYY